MNLKHLKLPVMARVMHRIIVESKPPYDRQIGVGEVVCIVATEIPDKRGYQNEITMLMQNGALLTAKGFPIEVSQWLQEIKV